MAERYTHPISVKWMDQGLCPECGKLAESHSDSALFRLRPQMCSLVPRDVEDRIEQYQKGKRK